MGKVGNALPSFGSQKLRFDDLFLATFWPLFVANVYSLYTEKYTVTI
jgi:hypothetical protein